MFTNGTWSNFNIDTYNLEYVFDLKYYNATTDKYETIKYEVGANNTDQQKFINLVGSEVSTRVYDLDGPNPASIDRTPIVRVTLVSKNGAIDCPVLEGFIKLNIVEKKVVPVPPVTIDATGNVEAGCDDYTLTIGTQRMNEEFYAKAEVSKAFFHTNYVWASATDGVGTITQKTDPNDTESYNLVWTVTASDLAANIGKKIEKSGTYTYGASVIKVTFSANITQPSVNLSGLLLDNMWFGNNTYVKHNVATPDLEAIDPALATYANNISAAFKTTADKLLDLKFANTAYEDYTYSYVFDIAANQPIKTVDGITISVGTGGKTLLAAEGTGTPEVVATILDFRLSNAISFMIEGNASILSDHFNSKKAENPDWQFNALAGFKINLGKTHTRTEPVYYDPPAPTPPPAPAPAPAPKPEPAPAPAPVVKELPVLPAIHFNFDSDVVDTQKYSEELNTIVSVLKEFANENVMITGYTDHHGPDNYNDGLSLRRAEAVKKYLVEQGINASRMTTSGEGKDPKTTGSESLTISARRVEVSK